MVERAVGDRRVHEASAALRLACAHGYACRIIPNEPEV